MHLVDKGSRMFTLQGRDCGVGGCVSLTKSYDGGGVSDQKGRSNDGDLSSCVICTFVKEILWDDGGALVGLLSSASFLVV